MSDYEEEEMMYDSDVGSVEDDENDTTVMAENRYFEAKGGLFFLFMK